MTPPAPTSNERERLAALERYQVLDTPAEAEFDDLTSLAAQICGTPIALISLVDAHRQWFKSKVGLEVGETSRDISFCGHAIHGRHVMEVPDAHGDFLFHDNPLVTGEPGIRFYAGMPLATPDGQNLGTLCVMDRIPRQLSAGQREALGRLGRQVMNQMELRLTNRLLATASTELREMEERSRALVEAAPNAILMVSEEGRITLVNSLAERLFGYSRDELLHQPVEMLAPERYRNENLKDGGDFFGKAEPGAISDFTGLRKDGTEVPIEISLRALPTSAGNVILASFTDVSARKRNGDQIGRLRRDLQQKRQQLERANRELTDLTSAVSHDLMTPLRGIGSLANWLVTSYSNRLDGSGREQLNLLALKVRRLNALVDGLLTDPPRNGTRENRAVVPFKLAVTASPSKKKSSKKNGSSRNSVSRPSSRIGAGLGYSAGRARVSANELESSEPVGTIAVAV